MCNAAQIADGRRPCGVTIPVRSVSGGQGVFATFPKDASPPLSGDRLSSFCRSISSQHLYVHAYLYGSNVSCICGRSVSRLRADIATASRERMPIVPSIPRINLRPKHDSALGNTSVSSSLPSFFPAQSSCPLIIKIKTAPHKNIHLWDAVILYRMIICRSSVCKDRRNLVRDGLHLLPFRERCRG